MIYRIYLKDVYRKFNNNLNNISFIINSISFIDLDLASLHPYFYSPTVPSLIFHYDSYFMVVPSIPAED